MQKKTISILCIILLTGLTACQQCKGPEPQKLCSDSAYESDRLNKAFAGTWKIVGYSIAGVNAYDTIRKYKFDYPIQFIYSPIITERYNYNRCGNDSRYEIQWGTETNNIIYNSENYSFYEDTKTFNFTFYAKYSLGYSHKSRDYYSVNDSVLCINCVSANPFLFRRYPSKKYSLNTDITQIIITDTLSKNGMAKRYDMALKRQ